MWPFKVGSVRVEAAAYRVVSRGWREHLLLAVLGVVGCASLVAIGLQIGRQQAADALANNERLNTQLEVHRSLLETARERLAELTVSGAATLGAREVVLQDFQQLTRRIGELENELRYYRAVMPEAKSGEPLRIASFETLDGRHRETRVVVLLTQNLRARKMISGRLDVSFRGTVDGKAEQYSLADMLISGESQVDFSFRYYQALPMSIALPENFVPESVVVVAHLRKTTVKREFPWALDGQQPPGAVATTGTGGAQFDGSR